MIDSETIRAARGGVADGHGRECHVVDESAADGDSVPLVDISRDSRERIEADAWEAARLDMSRTWEERRDAIVALLDRQAAITEREVEHDLMKAGRMAVEVERKRIAELEAELDEYDQTHMELPVDADGVPIKMGDNVVIPQCYEGIVVSIEVGDMETLIGVDGHDGYLRYGNSDIRHVEPRTVEDVLRDCCTEWNEHLGSDWETGVYAKYAAELRELMVNDGLAPESGVSGNGWRSNDGEVDV